MAYKYLRIHRPTTGTTLTVDSPFEVHETMDYIGALLINKHVEVNWPGFEAVGVITEDQKKMLETQFVI